MMAAARPEETIGISRVSRPSVCWGKDRGSPAPEALQHSSDDVSHSGTQVGLCPRGLGVVLTQGGFLLSRHPDTVRAPDIAFIHKHNFPAALPEDSFWPGAPDLAVEVVSPNDTIREIEERVRAWLEAGTKMVWVVNPKRRTVSVHRSATDPTTLTEKDELTGGDVVPGFRCRVRDVFAAS